MEIKAQVFAMVFGSDHKEVKIIDLIASNTGSEGNSESNE